MSTVLITQTFTGVSNDVLQNIPIIIVLGGNVVSISQVLSLTSEDVKWLTKALIITGPIKMLGYIELMPAVKGLTQ